jgi:integrase
VPFPDFVADHLSARMLGKGGDDLVFNAPGGGVLRVSHWRPRVFNPARDSLKGFPKVTPHDLRHTAASLVVSAGGNVLAAPWGLSPAESLSANSLACQGERT